ncbi:MAG: sulfatase-like hydrolase/transferase [Pirellulales bacterium]|nr:sulfatase-like hydrolase/transferase [Pirellulales bacterium]
MDDDRSDTRAIHGGTAIRALHVLTLWNLAFAARLYELLGRQPMFFIARKASAADVVAFVLILSVLLPALVFLAPWSAGLVSRRAGWSCHLAVVFGATVAMVLAALNPIELLRASPGLLLAISLGALATVAYCRFRAARALVTILSPSVVLFPGLFLFGSPVCTLLAGATASPASNVRPQRPIPVVMIVLDEFCGTSLMDERLEIDSARYPNFAALAEDATWYRNATTVSPSTHHAIPALLTGRYAKGSTRLPVAADFPDSLFTLLAGSHEVMAWETAMQLCPDHVNRLSESTTLPERLPSLLLDAAILEMHLLFSDREWFDLPDVTGRWCHFAGQQQSPEVAPGAASDRGRLFQTFVQSMGPSQRPRLYFAHVMLPHVPWSYTANGKEYSAPFAPRQQSSRHFTHGVVGMERGTERWADDEWAVTQAQQRYLLQLGYVDRLLGTLVAHLEREGLYDQSLIVITADHGVSFRPGDERRGANGRNYPDIMSIPLFVKAPNQAKGVISDRNAQSADVLPTIADVLGIELPWKVDGNSLCDFSAPESPNKQIAFDEEFDDREVFDKAFEEKRQPLQQMLGRFGSGQSRQSGELYKVGPHHELVDRLVEDFRPLGMSSCRIELAHGEWYENVDLGTHWLPCYIGGRVIPGPEPQFPLDLAIAVNGTIRAVTRTFRVEDFEDTWGAMVPDEAFRPGRNEIQVLVIVSAGNRVQLLEPMSGTVAR